LLSQKLWNNFMALIFAKRHLLKSFKSWVKNPLHSALDFFTDGICLLSLIGIWLRFIETKWLQTSRLTVVLSRLKSNFNGFKLAHLSDLHLGARSSLYLLKQLQVKLEKEKPDLICFTGDLLCYSQLDYLSTLKDILVGWRRVAPVVICLGNHDYHTYVTQRDGLPHIQSKPSPFILRAFKRLFKRRSHPLAHQCLTHYLEPDPRLLELLKSCDILCLQGQMTEIIKEDQTLKLLGLDDLWAASLKLKSSVYKEADIILAHNPDTIDLLKEMPSSLILSGHTHGGNINLPWIRKRVRSTQHPNRLAGLFLVDQHQIYINRGLSSPYPLRFLARPELSLFTLQSPFDS
jgi:predicted MPP superfamily phosphohydrolase